MPSVTIYLNKNHYEILQRKTKKYNCSESKIMQDAFIEYLSKKEGNK